MQAAAKTCDQSRNLFDDVTKLNWLLGGSAKRKEIFFDVAAANESFKSEELSHLVDIGGGDLDEAEKALQQGGRRLTVPKFCPTRWSARATTLSALMLRYSTVLEALETISRASTGDARSDADAHVRMLEDPQFIAALAVTQAILSYLAPVTKKLQAKDCNLATAYRDVALARECIRDARSSDGWAKVWSRAEQLAVYAGVIMIKPHTTQVQRHCASAATDHGHQVPSDYYRVNVYYPFH